MPVGVGYWCKNYTFFNRTSEQSICSLICSFSPLDQHQKGKKTSSGFVGAARCAALRRIAKTLVRSVIVWLNLAIFCRHFASRRPLPEFAFETLAPLVSHQCFPEFLSGVYASDADTCENCSDFTVKKYLLFASCIVSRTML